ncbi:tRNA (N6-isopentenyl adenosine(37)-C2)-methylthiotransferase MiaB [Clostridium sp. MD294]|uniref:tRNA (N6-isopentenyl adenosine(37)-C2)-methylthiotransferase MiaB n=1 Tax=Clostridium sp. MD294 TaxID=97138 RepID=UPI0002CBC26E|nr:tRNA (N6-isopentenyl adenosine(37)-C2)-methylthiotransferase MiaB [Clostridium sp. MD294]NDO46042.1 tRNA (N6-isopentenyl adenosine(37)-C2)-methylthiotransferase MiaB [Clostridium sp. MD294]USF30294.1 tRNA-2-methylthio-N(6)-dimethylallyladenosine synthase [Clostridium sp. MD294]
MEKENNTVATAELIKQQEYMYKMRTYISELEQKIGRKQSYFILTTGCQMNAHDSEKLAGMLENMGYIESPTEETADFVIYNTCCIRENAEEKVYGRLGRLKYYKGKNKNMKIALCGCMTQQDIVIEKLQKSYKYVDIVFGTFNLYKLPELLYNSMQTEGTLFDIWKDAGEIIEDIPTLYKSTFQASVNIMYGCENFCSYCIVPYVRGKERSRKPEDIIHEIENLVKNGTKEVMLLGQNVNSYGKNLETPLSFAKLLQKINEIDGLERIRFMTSHPKDLSDELIETIKSCKKVCNYIHLPIQSGSSAILKKMNRRYTKEQYLELVKKLKNAIKDITISTDIIVGFPGETEEDFQQTLDVIRQVKYCTAFTFIYSKRSGTPAAKMENQIPEEIVKDRFNRLLEVLNPIVEEIHKKQIGTVAEVLVEEVSKQNSNILTGRTENNTLVHFEGEKELIGSILPVKIIDSKTFYVIGERI